MLEERLKAVMAAVLGVDPATLTEDASAETIPGWDSLHHMNLIVAVEDEFGLRLPEDELTSLTSWRALRDAVSRCVSDPAAL